MTVAPVPVSPLVAVILAVVLAIFAVIFREVASVGDVLVVIPIVVVVMVAIVDADICFLSFRFADDPGRCSDSGGQNQRAEVAIQIANKNPAGWTMRGSLVAVCPKQHVFENFNSSAGDPQNSLGRTRGSLLLVQRQLDR